MAKVVVLGGGFAGLSAARAMAGTHLEVTVVDRNNFHTFQPLLYQVATAGLEPADVAYPVRTIFGSAPNVTFRHGRATGIDLDNNKVSLAGGSVLVYDYLVVATGATTGYHGVPGAEHNALALYTLRDARRLRNRLLATLERVDAHPELYGRGAPMFVVVGGGPTGVETAGAIVELIDVCIRRDGLRIDRSRTKVVLVDVLDRLVVAFNEEASRYTRQVLQSRGVEVRTGQAVAEVTPDGVRLGSGEFIEAAVVVWAGGVSVDGTIAGSMGVEKGRGGRVLVEPDLSVGGHRQVFVVGDAALVPLGGGRQGDCPQLAQVAMQSGAHAANRILEMANGYANAPRRMLAPLRRQNWRRRNNRTPSQHAFAYHDKGIMATIGRRAAVAQLGRGTLLTGTNGWLAWLGLHLVYLIGFRNKLSVLVNWFWRYLQWPSGPRLIVTDDESTSLESTSLESLSDRVLGDDL